MYLPVVREQMSKLVMFSNEEWAVISKHLRLMTLKKKAHFTRSGEVCDHLGLILSGSLRLYHLKDGEDRTGYFGLPNDFVSSYKSFLKHEPGIPSIQALEDTVLITLSYLSFQDLLIHPVTAHKMERFARLIAENMIFCYEDRMEGFVSESPAERYETLLKKKPAIVQQVPQYYLANYLGITATSLSRIRKRISVPAK
ncbi:MAG: Crp/Fnr family transcriptional regulator [Chitinophagaceae bacterium]